MDHFELHPEFYNNPILLTEEEKLNPVEVIKEFFSEVNLLEVRMHLGKLIEVALTSNNYFFLESSERGEILAFSKQLEKLVEAAKVSVGE